jgi:hypothetical protein
MYRLRHYQNADTGQERRRFSNFRQGQNGEEKNIRRVKGSLLIFLNLDIFENMCRTAKTSTEQSSSNV